jgi:hypothetical protein
MTTTTGSAAYWSRPGNGTSTPASDLGRNVLPGGSIQDVQHSLWLGLARCVSPPIAGKIQARWCQLRVSLAALFPLASRSAR